MAKNTFELSLVSVRLAETGKIRKRASTHAVTAALLWPRTGTARKEYALVRDFDKGATDLSDAPWHESILCRESVDGTFALHIEVSEALSDSGVESFLATFAGLLLRGAASAVARADLSVADAASALFSTASKKTSKLSSPGAIAAGTVTLDPEQLRDGLLLEIPLAAPAAITASTPATIPGERGVSRSRKTLLAKGAPNGTAVLKFHLVG